jgi:hypothetical protein
MGSVLSAVVVLVVLAAVAAVAILTLRIRRRTHDEPAAGPTAPDLGIGGGWHGPSASGGFPAADPARRRRRG